MAGQDFRALVEARDRTRRLRALTAALSNAVDHSQVASIVVDAARGALGAGAGFAWLMRDDGTLELAAAEHGGRAGRLDEFRSIPATARLPVCDAIRTGQPLMFESLAAMSAAYPDLLTSSTSPFRAWAVLPFVVSDRGLGGVVFSFEEERAFSDEDRELLTSMAGQVSLALERCRLIEAERRARADALAARERERELNAIAARLDEAVHAGEEQLRAALTAARAATWKVERATMQSTRDASYLALLGVDLAHAAADFELVHPDDRAIARAAFERTMREGAPYEPEVRLRRGDGSYLWVRAHGRVIHGASGEPAVLAGVIVDIDEAKRANLRAEEERRISETLHRLGSSFASELDHDRLVQLITLEVARLVGASWAAFAAAGAAPEEEPAMGSRLAVPVAARSGEAFGTLRFGHPEPGRFTADHARLAASIAGQAAIALENARLYQTVRAQKAQLELAVERAQKADRRKDEFLAMLGHELRNPLAPISTALELMELRSGGRAQKERDVIRRQVEHLSRLVADLLDVSRITRGKIQLATQAMEIDAVLAKAIEMASPLLEKRLQRLVIDVPRSGLAVDADPTRLSQVFQNLLTNASKYSEPHTEIALRARGAPEQIVVEVRDRGIGIPADVLPRLFDLFVQGERAIDRSEGGLGIGLSIAKSLCELHGGTIEAASDGPGRGSTFTVTLPRAARGAADAPDQAGPALPRAKTGVRVLVVDDNLDAAEMLRELLEGLGHEAAIAHDGVAALDLASSFRPDIALLDIGLPVMDGYEVARQLRERPGGAALRLIAVTGYGQDGDRARAREAGFDHHLIKPIAIDVLMSLLGGGADAR